MEARILKRVKDKNYRAVLARCVEQGATITHEGAHIKVWHPNGKDMVVCSVTPSDKRSWLNTRSHLRRAGFTC